MNEILNVWNTLTPVELLLFWIWFFLLTGIIGAFNFGFKNGPDYSDEVKDKVLDTSDNKWKTVEQIEAELLTHIRNSIEAGHIVETTPEYALHKRVAGKFYTVIVRDYHAEEKTKKLKNDWETYFG
jgi:hypothetical protein